MKLHEISLTPPVAAISVALLATLAAVDARATDRYVSEDKSYGADLVPPEQLFDDLQAAIDASSANDTVWVDDGFVCDKGESRLNDYWDKSETSNRVSVISKANLLIRSKSGYVDESKRKGATIRGSYNSDAAKCGVASVRPILLHDRAKLQGFILENGSANATGTGGGAWLYRSTLTNCVIRNCFAANGGGVGVNNSVAGHGVFCSVISNNVTTGSGGGLYGSVDVYDTLIDGNTASLVSSTSGTGGGAAGKAALYRCMISGNVASYRGGGTYNSKAYNCRFVGNVQRDDINSGGGGAAYSYANDTDEYCNCLFTGNMTASPGCAGIQAYSSDLKVMNCTIYANTNTHLQSSSWSGTGGFDFGNAAKKGLLVNVISWGHKSLRDNDSCGLASNCCFKSSVTFTRENCISDDPKLTDDGKGNLIPKNRACLNAGVFFDWMTEKSDVRSKDLAGHARLDGELPDMGCFEKVTPGLLLLLK